MIQLSIRKQGWGGTWLFGQAVWQEGGKAITAPQIADRLTGKRVLVLVHGYNVEDPIPAYGSVREAVGRGYDEVVGVHWPGSRVAAAFWLACLRANKAGQHLAEALKQVASEVASLDIEGHSLGCRVVLEALKQGVKARLVLLAAAAVDNEVLGQGEEYGPAASTVGDTLLVAYSRNDPVLRGAYTLAKWDKALGLVGPEKPKDCPPTVGAVDLSHVISAHGDYKRNKEFFEVWKSLLPEA